MFAYFPVKSIVAHRETGGELFCLIVGEGVNKEDIYCMREICVGKSDGHVFLRVRDKIALIAKSFKQAIRDPSVRSCCADGKTTPYYLKGAAMSSYFLLSF